MNNTGVSGGQFVGRVEASRLWQRSHSGEQIRLGEVFVKGWDQTLLRLLNKLRRCHLVRRGFFRGPP